MYLCFRLGRIGCLAWAGIFFLLTACEANIGGGGEEPPPPPPAEWIAFTPEKGDVVLDCSGTRCSVAFHALAPWTAELIAPEGVGTDWLAAERPGGAAGAVELPVIVSENQTFRPRSAILKLKAMEKEYPVKITQKGRTDYQVSVSVTSQVISDSGASFSVSVASNADWSLSGVPNWITVSPDKGSGQGIIEVTCEANPLSESRKATLRITAGNASAELEIVQEARKNREVLYLDQTNQRVDGRPGGIVLNVVSNAGWKVSGATEWLTVHPTSGSGNKQVSLVYGENSGLEARSVALMFVTESGAGESFTLVQDGMAPESVLGLSHLVSYASYREGELDVSVTALVPWSVTALPDWVTVTPMSGETGRVVKVAYTGNQYPFARSGTIVFSGGGQVRELQIHQGYHADLSLVLGQTRVLLNGRAGAFSIQVSANARWRISGIPEWIRLEVESGDSDAVIPGTFLTNTTGKSRSAVLVFQAGYLIRTLTLWQKAEQLQGFNEDEI